MSVTLDQTILVVGDIGATLTATIIDPSTNAAKDISAATTMEFHVRKPAATTDTFTCTFTSDGTDGKIYYTTVSGDIDMAGTWTLEARIVSGSEDWRTVTQTQFRVRGAI